MNYVQYKHYRLRTLSRLELLRLASTADTTVEPPEGDDLVVGEDIAEVGVRLRQLEAYISHSTSISHFLSQLTSKRTGECGRDLAHVFEVGAQVLAARARGCRNNGQIFLRYFLRPRGRTLLGVCGNSGGGVAN